MHKKNYEQAALMIRKEYERMLIHERREPDTIGDYAIEDFMVEFFQADNPKFNEERFREACKPRCGSLSHRFSNRTCTKALNHEGKCN